MPQVDLPVGRVITFDVEAAHLGRLQPFARQTWFSSQAVENGTRAP
ncbi:hypothetical protein [Oceanimonas baumannii]|nr:hypothetical protein [Oceanimonas baumannii]